MYTLIYSVLIYSETLNLVLRFETELVSTVEYLETDYIRYRFKN